MFLSIFFKRDTNSRLLGQFQLKKCEKTPFSPYKYLHPPTEQTTNKETNRLTIIRDYYFRQ